MEAKKNLITRRIFKYIILALVVALSTRYIPIKPLENREVIIIALIAGSTYCLVDTYSPTILA